MQVLTHISQAGCGVSMIFLAFTMTLYVFLRWVILSLPCSSLLPSGRVESSLVMPPHTRILFTP